MISLSDFIIENTKKMVKMPNSAFNTLDECLDLNGKTINTITNEELNYFDHMVFNQIFERNRCYLFDMNEMLNSHSAEILIKLLKDLFGEYIIGYHIYNDELPKFANNSTMFDIYVKDGVVDDTTEFSNENDIEHKYYSPKLKLKEFESIIQSYQYFITLVYKVEDYFCISCEPKFTERVKNTYGKYGYHVIYTGKKKDHSFGIENVNKILKVRLRPQVGVLPNGDALVDKVRKNVEHRYDSGVRYFPERTYFFLDNDNLYDELNEFIHKQKGWRFGEYIIIKFLIGNAAMFKNPASTDDNNVFTYDGISRKNLKEFLTDYRDFKDYKEGDDTSEFSHKKLN